MSRPDNPPAPDRAQTDESLRLEREVADDALGGSRSAVEATADEVLTKARARADQVLAAARARTDRQTITSNADSSASVVQKRALEDASVRKERNNADEIVRAERAEHVSLLSAEREETDKDLSVERTRADSAVATRDEFLGIVSHDLRNMLGAMLGFASLIGKAEAEANHGELVQAYVQRIGRSGARMNRLIGDLVDLASIEAGRLAVTTEMGDPATVVTEAVDTFQTHASACGVSLTAAPAPTATLTMFDPARILQVLTNLLSNAIKFTPANGKVVVRIDRIPNEIRFAVSDSGIGIPADKLETVFERFHQVARNDRRGVGLGLYISKCIVHGHGGRTWAESKLGEGSTFYFTLPVSSA